MRSLLISRRLIGAAFLLATFAACAAPDDASPPAPLARDEALRATLALPAEAFAAHERPVVTVTITNTTTRPERVLSSYVGGDGELAAPVLAVWRDGAPVAYRGPLVKWSSDDFVTLAPGAAITRRVDLADLYDLTRSGDYTVRVQVPAADLRGVRAADPRYVLSSDGAFWAEGRPAIIAAEKPGGGGGSCNATQQSQLSQAAGVASSMSSGARSYLTSTPPSGTSRYVTWFGAFSAGGWNTASAHYDAIANAFATQTLTFDCGCKQKNVYAFVNPNQPYVITLCGAFWPAPMSGTDSKGGTLVHEMSHFNVTAGTNDWAYGQTACRSLATSDPTKALDNADSHEYFAENSPVLP